MARKPKFPKGKALTVILLNICTFLCACIMLMGLGLFLMDRLRSNADQQAFQELAELVQSQTTPAVPEADKTAPTGGPEEMEQETVPATEPPSPYQVLYDRNPDFAGWLTVPGTAINYPVVHTPADIEHYIHRAFDGSESDAGTPFVGANGSLDETRCAIYGHNMKDGTMFHDLLEYKSKEFWQENPTFTIHTLEGERTYEIFSAVRTRVLTETETGLRYYRLEDGIEEWLMERALYDTGITVSEGDTIVILSTCSYHTDEGRFIIAGKLVE